MKAFILMWVRLLNESTRELSYTAKQAGISLNVTWNGENMGFQFFSYNEGYQSFFGEALKELQTFVPSKELFESKKTAFITGLKNSLMGEPYNRLDDLRSMCLGNMTLSTEELIQEAENLTYDAFRETQKDWLQNLHIRWLI